MPGQVLNAETKLKVLGYARVLQVEPRILKGVCHCVSFASPLPLADKARQPAQRFLIEAKRFTPRTGCGLAAIGNDVRRHCSTKFTIPLIDVLDCLLSLVF